MIIIYFITILIFWIALLFYPSFDKKQLWKTIVFGFSLFCPILLIGIILGQKIGYDVHVLIRNILGVSFLLYTPFICLIFFVWNIVDIVKYSRIKSQKTELLRALGQMVSFWILIVFLLLKCGPMTMIIVYGGTGQF